MGRYGVLGLCLVIVTLADVSMARMIPSGINQEPLLDQVEAAADPVKSSEEEEAIVDNNLVPVEVEAAAGPGAVEENKNLIAYGGIGGYHGIGGFHSVGGGGIGKFGGIGGVAGVIPVGGIPGGLGGAGAGGGLGGIGGGGLGGLGGVGGGGDGSQLPGAHRLPGVGAVFPHP